MNWGSLLTCVTFSSQFRFFLFFFYFHLYVFLFYSSSSSFFSYTHTQTTLSLFTWLAKTAFRKAFTKQVFIFRLRQGFEFPTKYTFEDAIHLTVTWFVFLSFFPFFLSLFLSLVAFFGDEGNKLPNDQLSGPWAGGMSRKEKLQAVSVA